jgi:uncharacterized RDD family membrane protein YckC
MTWYYVEAGQQQGPVDEATLNNLAATGRITPETLVWKEGMANWQPYREFKPAGLNLAGVAVGAGGSSAGFPGMGQAVCAECKGIFPIDDTIGIGNVRVCANCKPIFVQKMSEGLNVLAPGSFRYAGFWVRFAAVFLDGSILYIFNVLVNLAFGIGITASFSNRMNSVGPALTFGLMGMQLLVSTCYEAFFIGKYGATPGKMACKIKVIVADGNKLSYLRAIGRYFAKFVSYLTCWIGFIMAGFDDEKRSLHDRICDTRVIYK